MSNYINSLDDLRRIVSDKLADIDMNLYRCDFDHVVEEASYNLMCYIQRKFDFEFGQQLPDFYVCEKGYFWFVPAHLERSKDAIRAGEPKVVEKMITTDHFNKAGAMYESLYAQWRNVREVLYQVEYDHTEALTTDENQELQSIQNLLAEARGKIYKLHNQIGERVGCAWGDNE